MVVGLGNPGSEYQSNRHNLGFMVLDELLGRAGHPSMRRKFGADLAEATLAGGKLLFCKPMEFMNTSGQAVARVAQFWKVPPSRTVVVHDELDVPFARLRLAAGGGPGGHNGLRSIIGNWGTPDFARVRVGVGRPPAGRDSADYVLSNFSQAEAAALPALVAEAADAVESIIGEGLTAAMNKFNAKKRET